MFKAMILLKRQDGLSFHDFMTWWLQDHAPLARQLPGVRRAVFNVVRGDGDGPFDGISELWFDSEQDFADAYASETGKTVAADSMSHVAKRERLLVEENEIVSSA